MGAPAATVEASGFSWATSGHATAAAPTVATAPVATKRKSRRLCPAEDDVVTIPTLSYPLPVLSIGVATPGMHLASGRSIGIVAECAQVRYRSHSCSAQIRGGREVIS
jgi:hypothetical protein